MFLASDYARNIRDIEDGLAPEGASTYIQNASVTDPSLAPPGHSALYVLVNTQAKSARIANAAGIVAGSPCSARSSGTTATR